MSKGIITISIAIILIVGAGLSLINQKLQQTQTQPEKAQTEQKQESANEKYVEYSKAILDQSSRNRRVLYFYANWCPTCRPADANFKKLASKIPEDVVVIRVNYNDTDTDNEEKELAKKYGITYQHTFVQIDSNGQEVTKWNGGQIEELLVNTK